jgi:vitamin B12 transporter
VTGVDAEHSKFDGTADGVKSKGDANTVGAYLNGRAALYDRVFLNLGGRVEDHSDFGTHFTWRAGAAYLHLETDTRLHASYGTAFKAPGLFELYGSAAFCAGNPALRPEKSKGAEIGLDQGLFGGMVKTGATLFHNDITDLIQCPAPFVALQNVAKARTQGVETYFEVKPTSTFSVRFDYVYTDAENRSTGAPLLRRPRHKTSLTAEWRPQEDWTIGVEAVRNAGRRDIDAATFATTNPESYTAVRILAAWDVFPTLQVYGRVENAFDKHYDEPDGFKAPTFGAYGGVRVKF